VRATRFSDRGLAMFKNSAQSLFTKAIDEMRARYLLTFYPEGVPKPGWHPLKIGARGRGDVIARPGYFKGTAR
jgi:hypothetical protein